MRYMSLIKYFIFYFTSVFNNHKVDTIIKDMENNHQKRNNYEYILLKQYHNILFRYYYFHLIQLRVFPLLYLTYC